MEPIHLVAFNLTLLAAMASPGPALLHALRQSISGGRATGIATGAGLALIGAAWTGAALVGLDAIFVLVPSAYLAMKIAGAAYLIWIALHIWRHAARAVAQAADPGAHAAFWGGVLVNLLNPKAVLFAASVLVVIFPPGLASHEKALVVANHFIVEIVVYSAFATLLSTTPARAGYIRLKPAIDRAAALILGALGLRLLIDR